MRLTKRSMVPVLAIVLLTLIAGTAKPVHTAELHPAAPVAIGFDASTLMQIALARVAASPEARQLVDEARTLLSSVEETWRLLVKARSSW